MPPTGSPTTVVQSATTYYGKHSGVIVVTPAWQVLLLDSTRTCVHPLAIAASSLSLVQDHML
jgi:hypothetical protein